MLECCTFDAKDKIVFLSTFVFFSTLLKNESPNIKNLLHNYTPAPAAPAPAAAPAPMPPGLEPIDDAPPSFELNPEPEEAPPPMFDDEPEGMTACEMPATGPMTPAGWDALITAMREASPLQSSAVGNTMFISDDDGLVTVAIHPADTDTRDALLGDQLSELMATLAPKFCGHGITLRMVMDDSVPPPVAEEPPPPAPLPVPAPRPAAAPKPKAPEKKPEAEKPAAPASLKPTDEEFYHDPLIELALKEFHATLIK